MFVSASDQGQTGGQRQREGKRGGGRQRERETCWSTCTIMDVLIFKDLPAHVVTIWFQFLVNILITIFHILCPSHCPSPLKRGEFGS